MDDLGESELCECPYLKATFLCLVERPHFDTNQIILLAKKIGDVRPHEIQMVLVFVGSRIPAVQSSRPKPEQISRIAKAFEDSQFESDDDKLSTE